MRPLFRGGQCYFLRRHHGARVRTGDPVCYTDGGKMFLHRVWLKRGDALLIGDDAAVCAPHRIHRSQIIGSPVSRVTGIPGLLFGVCSHLAFRFFRFFRARAATPPAWLLTIIMLVLAAAPTLAVAPDAVVNLSALSGPSEAGTLTLTWSAPQEGAGNTVSAYDIRGATKTFTDVDWNAPWVRQLYTEPSPLAPGTPQSVTLTNLAQGTTYYFRIKSADSTGTMSPLSTDPPAWAPARRTTTETYDLSDGAGIDRWGYSSAAGDITTPLSGTLFTGTQYTNIAETDTVRADTIGTANNTVVAQRYLFKLSPSTATITLLRPQWTGWDEGAIGTGRIPTFYIWNYNTSAWTTIQTGVAQRTDQTLSGSYSTNMNYYVRNSSCNLKVICPAAGSGKKSYIHSNYVSLMFDYTVAADLAAPAAVTGLTADTGDNPNDVTLSWTSSGDDGTANSNSMMSYYIVKYATYAVTADTAAWWNGSYGAIQTYNQNWAVPPPKTIESKTLTMPAGNTRYWLALRTVDETGRQSGINVSGPTGSSCTVSAVSRPPLSSPSAPSALSQFTTASGAVIPAGSWINYQQIATSFTLTDPFWRNTMQYNVQFSTRPDFSYAHVSATAPASATLPQGTTRYTTALLPDGTWYWRVRASNSDGLLSAYSSMTVVNGRHFGVDTTSPAAPSLIAPVNGSTTALAAVLFDWTDVADLSGVREYTLRIATTSDFSGAVVSSATAASSATMTLPDGMWYYWAVRSSDTAGNIGVWSSSWTIRIDTTAPNAPVLSNPPYGSTTSATTPLFDWTNCDDPGGTGGYVLRISSAADISGTVISSSTLISQASLTLSEGLWYWTVRSSDTAGNTGAWADTWHIRIDTTPPGIPIPAAPLNGSTVTITSIDFDWSDVSDTSGVSNYVARFSTSPAFAGTVLFYESALSHVQADLADGLWYWTVRSSDTAGNSSEWSSLWNVRIDTSSAPSVPALQTPSDAAAFTQPNISFDWDDSESISGISIYTLRASTSPEFTAPVHSSYTQVSQAAMTLTYGQWYWTVRSSDTLGHFTDWASTRSFVIDGTPPSVPVLSAPQSEAMWPAESITFSWEESADATGIGRYTLRVATASNFTGTVLSSITATTSAALDLYEGTWYWTTRASDTLGNVSAWAEPWIIHVDTTPPSQPAPSAPAAGSTTTVTPVTLNWDASIDANGIRGYSVRAATSTDFSGDVISSWTALSSADLPLTEQLWYWSMRSSDTAGNVSSWTDAWTIRVDTTQPTLSSQLSPSDATIVASRDIACDWTDATDNLGVDSYTVRFSTAADFTGTVFSSQTAVSQASLTLLEGAWYWSVRAMDRAGNFNDWSPSWTVVIDTTPPSVPVLASPVNGSTTTVSDVSFLWSPSIDTNGISNYTVRASTYANFSDLVYSSCTALASAVITVPEGVWFWTVRSSDTAGNFSAWADTRTFNAVSPPTPVTDLTAVVDPSTAGVIDLSWSAPMDHEGDAVNAYDVRLATAVFTEEQWDDEWLFHAINEPAPLSPGAFQEMTVAGLVPGATYYFRMKSADMHGTVSLISAEPVAWACAGRTSAEMYDLSTDTGVTRWGYQTLIGDITTNTGGTQISSPQYAGVALLDSLAADTTGSSNKRIVAQRYQFKISHATNTITSFTPSWTGWIEQGPGTAIAPTLYIWNYNSAAWQPVATGTAQLTDQTFSTVTFTSNINYYVKNSSCNLKMMCPAASANVRSYIHSNYVRLTVNYTVSIDSVAPAAITDLAARTGDRPNEVVLNWTAPGDNGATDDNGSFASYTVYYATFAVVSNTGTWLAGGDGPVSTYQQTWTVAPRGAPEQFTLTMPAPAWRYWMAVRTTDEARNRSPMNISGPTGSSTTVNALSQEGMRIAINEVYASGSDGADWVELYNTTDATFTLTGCTLKYNIGTVVTPGAETDAWTAVEGSSLAPRGHLVIPGLTLDGIASQHVILKDAVSNTVDTVQWPAGISSGASFARLVDGSAYLELDPTPTVGYANALSTGIVRINEVICGADNQAIEFYNTIDEPLAQSPLYLRNTQMTIFRSTRTISALAYAGLDEHSISNNNLTWADCFGTNGLSASADVLVLENEAGQTVDRITWGSAATPYLDFTATSVVYDRAAPGNISAPHSLIRRFDGVDTGDNAIDVVISTETTFGMNNRYPANGAPTALVYPDANGIALPRRFKLALQLGNNAAAGRTNTAWFTRTGGAPDPHSPHLFQLSDWGVLPDVLTPQTTAQELTSVRDVDGHTLVDGGVYTLLVNVDNGTDASPQTVRTGLTCDATIHRALLEPVLLPVAGNNAQVGLFKLSVFNDSSFAGNDIVLSTVSVRLTDGSGGALNITDVFTDFYVCGDNPVNGTVGAYQPAIDTATLAHVSGAGLQLVNGTLTIPIDPSAAGGDVIASLQHKDFFLAARLAPAAVLANGYKAGMTPSFSVVWDHAPSGVRQPGSSGAGDNVELLSSSQTVIAPQPPASGTTYPAVVTAPGSQISAATVNSVCTVAYCASANGIVYALDNTGTPKWEVSAGGPVIALYDASYEENENFVYSVSSTGILRKIKYLEDSGNIEWTRDLGYPVSSDIAAPAGNALYIATTEPRLFKMSRDGIDADGMEWDQTPDVTGGLCGTPVIDTYSQGVNALWYPSTDGTFYRINTLDGSVSVPVSVSPGGIATSPNLLAGFASPTKNTHFIYFGDNDGYFRARNASNLTDKPADWPAGDVYVSSAIRSSPYFDGSQYFYFGADNGKLHKVDARTGAVVVLFQAHGPIRCMPVVGDNSDVYFGADDGCFYGISAVDGALLPGFPIVTGGEIRSLCWASDPTPRIYFFSNDGKAYCIEVP